MGVRDHAAWLCSSVFDGARTFEGVSPDLDLHCARVNASAATMHLKPVVSAEQWLDLTHDGIKRFAKDTALYIRPMYWAEHSGALLVAPDPDSTNWCLTLYEAPMRRRTASRSRCRLTASRASNACRSTPRPAASIRTMRAR